MTCPVCDSEMSQGYCTYGCSFGSFEPFEHPYHVYRIITLCKVCEKEFKPISSAHKYCSKECSKVATAEYHKSRPKAKYAKYAKATKKVADLTPEEILINKEVAEREARLARCHKIECKRCRYSFRSFDPEKEFCSKECEKISIENKKKLDLTHLKKKLPDKKCMKCKTKYKTMQEDVGLCYHCRLEQIRIEKDKKELKLRTQKWAEHESVDRTKENRKINQKLEWAATVRKDPVSKRLKVMRG